MLRFLRQSEFGRHVLILVGGAGVAQLLLIAASPLFTRLYTPANFGVYALFMAVVSVMATLRLAATKRRSSSPKTTRRRFTS